ncbi:hypothetical protein BDR04DRAFT_1104166, partial [Suillus decipiens]
CARETCVVLPLGHMQMEYSVDEIAIARNLQLLAYISISTATFWAYDFVCSLHEEVMHLFLHE